MSFHTDPFQIIFGKDVINTITYEPIGPRLYEGNSYNDEFSYMLKKFEKNKICEYLSNNKIEFSEDGDVISVQLLICPENSFDVQLIFLGDTDYNAWYEAHNIFLAIYQEVKKLYSTEKNNIMENLIIHNGGDAHNLPEF